MFYKFEGGEEKKEFVAVPIYGVAIINFSTLLQAVHWMTLKYLFILYPNIIGIKILLFRSIVATIVTYLYVNKGIKDAMWDSL